LISISASRVLSAFHKARPVYEPEDLPAAIAEAKRLAKEGLGGKGVGDREKMSPMLDLVGKAIEELIKPD
jgi:hypothetical protein